MPIEFDCEGCGDHVISFGMDKVPRHHLCGVCAWACEFITDPQELIEFMKHLRGTPNEKDPVKDEAVTEKTTIHIPCKCCGRPLAWLNARWTCLRCDS